MLSPLNTELGNFEDLLRILTGSKSKRPTNFPRNIRKAERLLFTHDSTETIVSGRKVTSFWRNLMLDLHPVTVDGHMWNIYRGQVEPLRATRKMPASAYDEIEGLIRQAAFKWLIHPAEFQACVWCQWRASLGLDGRVAWGRLFPRIPEVMSREELIEYADVVDGAVPNRIAKTVGGTDRRSDKESDDCDGCLQRNLWDDSGVL